MKIWEAALIVLYETPPEQWRWYEGIAREILDRQLYFSDNPTFSRSVCRVMWHEGRGHVQHRGGKSGEYRLIDHAVSASVYQRIKEREPWRFPAQQLPMQSKTEETAAPHLPQSSQPATKQRPKRGKKRQGGDAPDSKPNRKSRRGAASPKPLIIAEQLIAEEVPVFIEGATKRICIDFHERDQEARRRCISKHGLKCAVCHMRFDREYGEICEGFIHVHHLKPLRHGRQKVDPEKDLQPVCPNCHAMLHKGDQIQGKPFSIDELKELRRMAKRRASDWKRRTKRVRTRSSPERHANLRRRSRGGKT